MKIVQFFFIQAVLFAIILTSASAKNLKYYPHLTTQINPKLPIHTAYNLLLQKYVSNSGKVNYKGFKKDILKLQSYLNSLKSTHVNALPQNEQLAFWINVYNACTIDQVLRNYPCASIKEIENGKVWDKPLPYPFYGEKISLNDIEQQKLLQQFNDPRIHFAINCAALSCPKLSNIAFTGQNVQQLLNSQTILFINNPIYNNFDDKKIMLSQIFNWYKTDFVKSDGGVLAFVNKYAKTKINESLTPNFIYYNWDLNE
ncbi:MAG: DUF547 domain-containing protein [Sphingobacteriales bacterium]|nr:MAG: DUF547 domain-containing protein [Sphingobacteriales bacterium]TAF78324.1 MAG: DUF547 domain-containing protein [Sphingobacteriales bacterium]